ncbi:FAD-dependent oxidoreductase [Deinococcus aquiradiocola]|uniref:Pyridine nucleotide-disulfide oxidoreductase n=1 Tax=Deinococcus aquiradiocola TaxID=393059 RepID=A0A917PAD8_9DEIO|nr:FAD-dependent oxidoreductase [Deinococcus aquiradiocola]GGJ68236.1 pyridine nucleotide-disulfide oxidoreductase [Deinococcus aquiradiocola]
MPTLTFQLNDVPDGGMRTFDLGDALVLVTRDGDAVHAMNGRCPHAGANLGEGVRCGDRVVCPWHHATFHAASGALTEPPALQGLAAYTVTRDGAQCTVDPAVPLERPAPAPQGRPEEHTVIVGGGPAGFMAAQTLRQEGYAGRVTLLTAEPHAPYDRTALSKGYLSGKVQEADLPLGGPDWARTHGVDLRAGTRVTAIDRASGRVTVSGTGTFTADRVLVSTGSQPVRPDRPGTALDGVFTLRTLEDARALRDAARGADLVIVGGSFIGLEAASSLVQTAASVTVVAQEDEIMSRAVTPAVGRAVRRLHEEHGVTFRLGAELDRLDGDGQAVTGVTLRSGETLPAGVVLLGTGVRPVTDLLGDAADEKGAVHPDALLRLDPDTLAAGDIASAPTVLGEMRVEHWRVALQHGMVAAYTLLGRAGGADGESMGGEGTDVRVPFFWTQQYGKSLRYVGHAESLHDTACWGDPDAYDFMEFTFDGDRTVVASAMGRDRALAAFAELLRMGRAPTPTEIRAGEFDLVERLTA